MCKVHSSPVYVIVYCLFCFAVVVLLLLFLYIMTLLHKYCLSRHETSCKCPQVGYCLFTTQSKQRNVFSPQLANRSTEPGIGDFCSSFGDRLILGILSFLGTDQQTTCTNQSLITGVNELVPVATFTSRWTLTNIVSCLSGVCRSCT